MSLRSDSSAEHKGADPGEGEIGLLTEGQRGVSDRTGALSSPRCEREALKKRDGQRNVKTYAVSTSQSDLQAQL